MKRGSKVRKPIGVEHHVGQLTEVIKRLRLTLVLPVRNQVIDAIKRPRDEQRKADLRDASVYLCNANDALKAAVDLLTPPTSRERTPERLMMPVLKTKKKRAA